MKYEGEYMDSLEKYLDMLEKDKYEDEIKSKASYFEIGEHPV